MTITAYVETVSIYSSGTVSDACSRLARRAGPFMPSAGELAAECERIDQRERDEQRYANRGRLPPPSKEMTEDQRVAVKARFDDLIDDLKQRVESEEKRTGWRPPTEAEAKAWLEAHEGGQGVRPVVEFSPSLVEKLREMRIADDERFAEVDAWARETIG
jgi:hypothetical protein